MHHEQAERLVETSRASSPTWQWALHGSGYICLLCAQVGKLRQEKDVLEGKLREFERSLQKLKDCTFQEATQKRSYERKVQQVEAEIRGAELREKVGLALIS